MTTTDDCEAMPPTEDDATDESPLYWTHLHTTDSDQTVECNVRDVHSVELDEAMWSDIGEDRAPCPIDYLLIGVAGCQLEVLKHCLKQSHVDNYEVSVAAEAGLDEPGDANVGIPDPETNKISAIKVDFEITTTDEFEGRAARCMDIAERICIATRSVREGIAVPVSSSVTVREVE